MENMSLGIFTPEVAAATPAELFEKIKNYGFTQVQFDFLSVLGEEVPADIPDALLAECRAQADKNGVKVTVVNGTYNMAHPDATVREEGARRFGGICRAAQFLGGSIVSLCTGTRTRECMWVPHPNNNDEDAWRDMLVSVEKALADAEKYDVVLGLETEASNVCNSPEKVLRLIKEMQSPRLRVIMDCANLFSVGTAYKSNVRDVIRHGFDVLGEYVVIAHGKDIKESDGISFTYTGSGIVDFPFFLDELDKINYHDGMIIHGTKHEDEIPKSVDYLRRLENMRNGGK